MGNDRKIKPVLSSSQCLEYCRFIIELCEFGLYEKPQYLKGKENLNYLSHWYSLCLSFSNVH